MGSERRLGPIPPGPAGNGLDTFLPLVQTPHMITDTTTTHPGRIRGTENLHILLWIVKDTCWVQDYRLAGVLMILPTISVAIYLTAQARAQRDEFIHNLAVVFWLCANSVWMIGEFFFDDHTRTYALVFFGIGLLTLAFHYLPKCWRYARSRNKAVQL
jgi:uncharacterized membrane protein (GlpM family)